MAVELNNVQVEARLLATMLRKSDCRVVLVQTVRPEMFSDLGYKGLCSALVAMHNDGRAVDDNSLEAEMTKAGTWNDLQGRVGLAKLQGSRLVAQDNLDFYVDALTGLYVKRMVYEHANRLLENLEADTLGPQELLAMASQGVSDISSYNASLTANSITYKALMDDMENLYNERIIACTSGKPMGITTGFASLNSFTGGWKPGQLIIIASYTSRGKTVFVEQLAVAAAKAGKHVQFVSLEMSPEELGDRAVARITGLGGMALQTGHISPDNLKDVASALGELSQHPIEVMHRNNSSVSEIVAYAKLRKMQGKCDMLIVDYLQIVEDAVHSRDGRRVEIANIIRKLKHLARDMSIPVVVVSQLRRPESGGVDTEPQPTLWMLKEAGEIENDASVVLLIYRPNFNTTEPDQDEQCKIIIAKQRNGPRGVELPMTFDKLRLRFCPPGGVDA